MAARLHLLAPGQHSPERVQSLSDVRYVVQAAVSRQIQDIGVSARRRVSRHAVTKDDGLAEFNLKQLSLSNGRVNDECSVVATDEPLKAPAEFALSLIHISEP